MLKVDVVNFNALDCYILKDQPATCGRCGARTNFDDIVDKIQLHECLNPVCGYKFITEEDEEF